MIQLSDYVIDFLVKKGIKDIFSVSGGGIMYLVDSAGRNKNINYISNHHEQACATAAEGYAKLTNQISACLVTSGPGATNAITGVAGAWFDSVPIIVISGQAKRELIGDYSIYRNLSPQDVNIVPMVKPITKYVNTVMDPESIRYELEKAFYLATSGRYGPVWIEIPLDVQAAIINEQKLRSFKPKTSKEQLINNKNNLKKDIAKLVAMLKKAQRPLLVPGRGIRWADGMSVLKKFLKKLPAPIILSMNGLDLIAENNPLLVGKFGPVGQRRGNFAVQNADLILSIGASMNVAAIGFDYRGFAPHAKKIVVNIDYSELTKPTYKADLLIESDAKDFMIAFLQYTQKIQFDIPEKWINACQNWKKKYPNIIPDFFKDKKHVNSYVFFDILSDLLDKDDVITTGNALDITSMYQGLEIKDGQRAFGNANFGSMGWCLPGAIGANIANNKKRSICITGDGSIQMNIQELETIKHYNLPIKIFVFNNKGYESIRATQTNLFDSRFIGSDERSGVTNPDFKLLAASHRLKYEYIKNNTELKEKIKKVLNESGPVLCEVNISYDQKRIPKSSAYRRPDGTLESKPLEDMFPFLPKEEVWENMHLFD